MAATSCRHGGYVLRAQVGLPYLKAKLDALYSRHSTRVDGVLGLGLARLRQAAAAAQPGDAVRAPRAPLGREGGLRRRLQPCAQQPPAGTPVARAGAWAALALALCASSQEAAGGRRPCRITPFWSPQTSSMREKCAADACARARRGPAPRGCRGCARRRWRRSCARTPGCTRGRRRRALRTSSPTCWTARRTTRPRCTCCASARRACPGTSWRAAPAAPAARSAVASLRLLCPACSRARQWRPSFRVRGGTGSSTCCM